MTDEFAYDELMDQPQPRPEPLTAEEEEVFRQEIARLRKLCDFSRNQPIGWTQPLTHIDDVTRHPIWSFNDQQHSAKCRNLRLHVKMLGSTAMTLLGVNWNGLKLLEEGGAHVDYESYEKLLSYYTTMWPRLFVSHEAEWRSAGITL